MWSIDIFCRSNPTDISTASRFSWFTAASSACSSDTAGQGPPSDFSEICGLAIVEPFLQPLCFQFEHLMLPHQRLVERLRFGSHFGVRGFLSPTPTLTLVGSGSHYQVRGFRAGTSGGRDAFSATSSLCHLLPTSTASTKSPGRAGRNPRCRCRMASASRLLDLWLAFLSCDTYAVRGAGWERSPIQQGGYWSRAACAAM